VASDRAVVALNGRFLRMRTTGIQRYAGEIASRLPPLLPHRIVTLVPPARVIEIGETAAPGARPDTAGWNGLRGHTWEQLILPRQARAAGATLLVSMCNWGPMTVQSQVLTVHDLTPFRHPELFVPGYAAWARLVTRSLAHRTRHVVTVSERSKADLVELLKVEESRLSVVPPGVGPPFTGAARKDPKGDYCVFVGAHDRRKNLGFLLSFWSQVWQTLGLTLHVVRRSVSRPHRSQNVRTEPGLVIHENPADQELADLYANARFLLWPSRQEGFGLPLVEAMAAGTPFLGTDVGAARDLAVDERQILPLDQDKWLRALTEIDDTELSKLRIRGVERALSYTWEHSAAKMAAVIEASL
jgi:glycosyltransferase involved in cell wall biosynthesis